MNTKLLKQKILDLAIRGKLTQQLKSDGTAADLLKEIADAKSALSQPKGKKSKNLGQIIPLDKNEAPFEIPANWEWVRLGDLCNASSGKTPSTSQKEFWNGNVLWVTSKDVKQKYIDSTQICLSDLGASSMQLYPPKTMIIVGRSGILRHTLPVAILKKSATVNQDLKALVFKDDRIVEFVYAVIKGMEQHLLHEYKKAGTTVDNLNFDLFLTAPIPLPPLAEQQRIVEKIQEAFAEIDSIENNKELLITHIKQARQKILDLAIHGKLVPQNKADEPASVLLERITRDNPHYEKIEDEPFEIPENWYWVALGSLSSLITKGTTPRGGNVAYIDNGVGFIRAENIPGMLKINSSNMKFIDSATHQGFLARSIIKEGDILITIAGSLGRTAIVHKSDLPLNTNQAISIVRLYSKKDDFLKYVVYALNSSFIQELLLNQTKVTSIPNLTLEIIQRCQIPLPPLNEQSRIVAKIEELFSTLDQMERNLV